MIILFVVAGIAGFGVVGMANSMPAISGINEIQTLEIVDNHVQSMRWLDLGHHLPLIQFQCVFKAAMAFGTEQM